MASEAAFLGAIRDDPDADDARLVFADWLEEQGDPRGELVRAQVTRVRDAETPDEARSLPARERDLVERFEATWLATFVGQVDHWFFFRGQLFADLGLEGLLGHRGEGPGWDWVEGLRLQVASPGLTEGLAALPLLGRLTTLDLGGSRALGDVGMATLLASPHLGRLRALSLDNCGLSDPTAAALGAAALPRLTRLDLSHNPIVRAGPLARRGGLPGVWSLSLCGAPVGDDGVRELLAGEGLPALTHLDLRQANLTDAGARALAESPQARRLQHLQLNHNGLTDAGARALAESPHLAGLGRLEVRFTPRMSAAGRQTLRERFGDRVHC